ncbi:regulatory LuxR family protein [Actinophytocola oryzae]|uniref:Regulatory LuxR family protein n=2 Tax=Actinophytocola oryzae TaxID=502181 RepID=A0A4R7W2P5_9PSEU|nr:regulatory LuxR family protein [Actinophytocola oryzae]
MAEIIDTVAGGSPRTVWIHGEPGIGKTTFARHALHSVDRPQLTVLDATAAEAESVLEFGVVEQIVRRVEPSILRGLPLLSRPVPSGTSPFAVGAEILALLGAEQLVGPVAMLVDDTQWIDTPSAQALAFVLRRIWADQVLTVLVSRTREVDDPDSPLHQLKRSCTDAVVIELAGLTGPDVGALSLAVRGHELPPAAAERIRVHAGGNPLHLGTLLQELPTTVLCGEHPRLPAPRSIVAAVRSTLHRLAEPPRLLLEALAVLDEPSPPARAAQVAGIPDAATAVGPAIGTGLLGWTSQTPIGLLNVTHSLYRNAIYEVIPLERRGRLHLRAARIVDPVTRWTHRVAATMSADPALATDLELAARDAGGAAQHMLAARYLRWAADLSVNRADYERRLLLSWVQTVFGPNRNTALAALPDITGCADSALRSLTLGLVALFATGDRVEAKRHLSAALDRPGDNADWICAVAAAGLAGTAVWSGAAAEAVEAARLAESHGGLPVRLADFVTVFRTVATCRTNGMESGLAELAHLPTEAVDVPPEQLDSLVCRGAVRTMLGDLVAAEVDLRAAIAMCRAGHHNMGGTTPLSYLAALHYVRGDWDDASILVDQALSLADPDEQPHHRVLRHMVACLVPAGRGQWRTATDHVDTAWAHANRVASPQDTRYAVIAEAVVHQARGEPAKMLTALRKLRYEAEPTAHTWWALWWRPLLVEALIATGHHAEGAEHLTALRILAAEVDYLRPTIVRLDAALSGSGASRRIEDQIADLAERSPRHSFFQAQLEADYGRRLADAGNARAALPYLTTALARFAGLGAGPFQCRTRQIIDRCAPNSLKEAPVSPYARGLSPRENQIAHLVRLNHTNREIAAELYITTKTVEYHLSNIFLKLGMTSRRQLRDDVVS